MMQTEQKYRVISGLFEPSMPLDEILSSDEIAHRLAKRGYIKTATTRKVYRWKESNFTPYPEAQVFVVNDKKPRLTPELFEELKELNFFTESEEVVDQEPKLSITYGYQNKDNTEIKEPAPIELIKGHEYKLKRTGTFDNGQICKAEYAYGKFWIDSIDYYPSWFQVLEDLTESEAQDG